MFSLFAADGAELVGVITERHKYRFNYVLFERQPESFKFTGRASVEAWSDQTMQVVWDDVRNYIAILRDHSENTGHRIRVYEVWGLNFPFSI